MAEIINPCIECIMFEGFYDDCEKSCEAIGEYYLDVEKSYLEYNTIGSVEEFAKMKQQIADGNLVDIVRCGECKSSGRYADDPYEPLECYRCREDLDKDGFCEKGERWEK